MLASTDPVLFLVLLLLLAVLLLSVRAARRRRAVDARLLAHATGHPSTGLPRGLGPAPRAIVARDVADQLGAAGMVAERLAGGALVLARGEDGEYTVDVGRDEIVVQYVSNSGVVELGRTAGACAAVLKVTEHARLTSR